MHHLATARTSSRDTRRGSALLLMLMITVLLVGMAAAALSLSSSSVREISGEQAELQSLYAAEAGIGAGLRQLAVSFNAGKNVDATLGTPNAPLAFDTDWYWTTIEENVDGTYTIRSAGRSGRSARSVEAIVEAIPPSPFEHAVFAGNLSGDPGYELEFGGRAGQADQVSGGPVYSGGDILVNDDATIAGTLRAHGDITGAPGQGGVKMDVPTILDIDFETYHDFDVAAAFESAPRLADDAGGTAGQLPATDPLHFLRKNPSDRSSDVNSTEKDDYFLEDPYETVRVDSNQNGNDAFSLSIPDEVNNRVLFIDGNLWIHNKKSYSFKIRNTGPKPTRLTIVVKGNVYFSDNLFYENQAQDGVAFIALADPDVEDSGNVYFGDPVFGTMRYAEALMFAENNFYDTNLDAAGSSKVEIRGNMTAGNQVAIERDFVDANGDTKHTKLDLTFDPRQAQGLLNLPGIPIEGDHPTGFEVVAWREVEVPKDAVALPRLKVRTPARPGQGNDPFADAIDPNSADALQSDDWRKRWQAKFGDDWKQNRRDGLWDDPVETPFVDLGG